MIKKLTIFLASLFLFFLSVGRVFAIYDPASVPNNRFGIHILDENDLDNAAKLVNSNGDWGYVTFVITEKERDHDRWQRVFDQMRRVHLIPIIRIATKANGDTWEKPSDAEIDGWIAFLNSLNWVIQNRYVVIGNEPNHANEWGGKVDPVGYGAYLETFSHRLKSASTDFFILPAALDASAKNTVDTMEESLFIRKMLISNTEVFGFIDGWTSHSYPNPDFSGSVSDIGKGTIGTFDWELSYLASLGVARHLPVFITETGWSNTNLSEDQIGANLVNAYQSVWNNARIIAVTPFILNYPQAPFAQFSWKKSDGSFYKFYSVIQNFGKISGKPIQIESGQIIGAFAQPIVLSGSDYIGAILAKNTGQSIWNPNTNLIKSDDSSIQLNIYSFSDIEPMRLGLIIFKAASPKSTGIYSQSLFLTGSKGQRITNSFPIEALLIKVDRTQVEQYLKSIFRLK